MSTRCTIKYSRPEDGPGFHLFEDAWLTGSDDPVELELFGVEAEVSTNGFARVVLPRAMARELGMLPPSDAAPLPPEWAEFMRRIKDAPTLAAMAVVMREKLSELGNA